MGDAADRARTARAEPPPLTSGHTLHWDGTGAVSQDGELPQDAAPAAGRVGRSTDLGRLDRLPAPPTPARERARAAALTLYLDAGLLLASGHTVLPGATGHLRWVPSPPQSARPAVVHPVLLVHTRSEALPVPYAELVLHLPRHDPLHRHIALVLEAERDARTWRGSCMPRRWPMRLWSTSSNAMPPRRPRWAREAAGSRRTSCSARPAIFRPIWRRSYRWRHSRRWRR